MIRIKTDRYSAELHEAAQQQPGAGQQHHRQCNFGDHQSIAQTAAAERGRAAAAFFQVAIEIGL